MRELTIKISEKMALVYDLETDVRFRQGVERGIERGIEQFIEKLLRKGLLTHEQIADVAEVSLERVQAIAQRLATS